MTLGRDGWPSVCLAHDRTRGIRGLISFFAFHASAHGRADACFGDSPLFTQVLSDTFPHGHFGTRAFRNRMVTRLCDRRSHVAIPRCHGFAIPPVRWLRLSHHRFEKHRTPAVTPMIPSNRAPLHPRDSRRLHFFPVRRHDATRRATRWIRRSATHARHAAACRNHALCDPLPTKTCASVPACPVHGSFWRPCAPAPKQLPRIRPGWQLRR